MLSPYIPKLTSSGHLSSAPRTSQDSILSSFKIPLGFLAVLLNVLVVLLALLLKSNLTIEAITILAGRGETYLKKQYLSNLGEKKLACHRYHCLLHQKSSAS
jgi:hypothetical protein